MATLGMMYPDRGGLLWGQMCYLKSGGSTVHPLGSGVTTNSGPLGTITASLGPIPPNSLRSS